MAVKRISFQRMTYDDAIAFWYGRINYEVKAANPGDLKLERMRALLRQLGDPHERFRSIHITGTKGKGSTAAMLASVLRSAGYRVGLFTSPHLVHVEERVQLDGRPISKAELTAYMAEIANAVSKMKDHPSFFEIGTAIGFMHFALRRAELAVIEVGLGGRFDSTNVIHPLVSIITSVGFDHTAQLGSTLEAIAYQKAGIIKRRVPVVSGVTESKSAVVISTVAKELGSPIDQLNRNFSFQCHSHSQPSIQSCRKKYEPMSLSLLGRHQAHNATLVVDSIERLRDHGLTISDRAIRDGLSNTKWPARIEIISQTPTIILDTAHNEPSINALIETIRDSIPSRGVKHCIFAVSNDKPYVEMLKLLISEFDQFTLTKYGNNPRSVPPEQLQDIVKSIDPRKPTQIFPIAVDAYHAVRKEVNRDDLICITGSFFLAGELLPVLQSRELPIQ